MVDLKEYIEHPELLDVLSMEDISEQMQEHPASTRLRWLWMLKKQREAGEPLKDLRLAWMHAPEMTSFHDAFRSGDSEDFYLDIESNDEGTEEKVESEDIPEPEKADKVESEHPHMDEEVPPSTSSQEKDLKEQPADENDEEEQLEKYRIAGAQTSGHPLEEDPPDSDFLQWLLQKRRETSEQEASADVQTPTDHSEDTIEEPQEPETEREDSDPSEEEKEALQAAIKKSIEEDEDILSPTLAEVLAEQGHTQRAIDMYEKLRLVYPEKSSYFAGKIEQLKNQ